MSDHYCCKNCGLRYDDCRCTTPTGRVARTAPNLQNLPLRTPEAKRVREAFAKHIREELSSRKPDPQAQCIECADPWKTPCRPGHCARKKRALSPARLRALQYAKSDVTLLVRRPGTYGSSDTRNDVRQDVWRALVAAGLLDVTLEHADDNAVGLRLTEQGRAALAASEKTP